MQIDWLTVSAQIVNFLVLVWLLHRFLYGPVVGAMDARERRIEARLREAQERKSEAEREAALFRSRSDELEREKRLILSRAEEEAERTRRSLEAAARQEVERRRGEWLALLDGGKQEFLHDMRRRSAERVFALARRALGELADSQLEERMAIAFARQIDTLEPDLRDRLADACRRAGGKVVIRAAVELDAEAQRRITRAVHRGLLETADVRYEPSEDAANGVELVAGSQTLSWTFARYIDELEQHLDRDLLEARARTEGPAAT